jgi:hypothetical protein
MFLFGLPVTFCFLVELATFLVVVGLTGLVDEVILLVAWYL